MAGPFCGGPQVLEHIDVKTCVRAGVRAVVAAYRAGVAR